MPLELLLMATENCQAADVFFWKKLIATSEGQCIHKMSKHNDTQILYAFWETTKRPRMLNFKIRKMWTLKFGYDWYCVVIHGTALRNVSRQTITRFGDIARHTGTFLDLFCSHDTFDRFRVAKVESTCTFADKRSTARSPCIFLASRCYYHASVQTKPDDTVFRTTNNKCGKEYCDARRN